MQSLMRWLLSMSAVALAYGVAARLTLFLAIPPGYATAVWPAAGIALAGVLLYGYRVWPGLVLGSFLANVWTSLDTTSALSILQSSRLPVMIGLGAALQALLGAFLVRRFTTYSHFLLKEGAILKFLFLGGPVSCVVSCTVGVTSLWVLGSLPWENSFFNWWTWWIGDTIGVIIFTPLILIWAAPRKQVGIRRKLFVTVPLAVGFVVVLLLFFYTNRWEGARIKLQWVDWSNNVVQSLSGDLNTSLDMLHSLESFFAGSAEVTRQEFRQFTRRMIAGHPKIQVVSWIPRIPAASKGAYEQTVRQEGFVRFRVTEQDGNGRWIPAAQRQEYFPLTYLEPSIDKDFYLGFDMASEPARRKAMNQACDTGRITATSRIPLITDEKRRFGFSVFLPVYKNGTPHGTVAERRENLQGYVAAAFLIDEMMQPILKKLAIRNVNVRLWDETGEGEERLLYDRGLKDMQWEDAGDSQRTIRMDFASRRWMLQFLPTQTYFSEHRSLQAWSILAGGLLFTGLFGVFLLIVGRTAVIEELIEQRTKELQHSNEVLKHVILERKKAEERFRLVVESAPNAMVMVGRDGRIVLVNAETETLFGYRRPDLIGQPIELLVPPRFRSSHRDRLDLFFLTPRTLFVGAARDLFGLRKDGTEVPVEIGLSPIETTEGSFALAAIIDLTERKKVDRMKNEFISMVSHELKTPLTSILGSIGLILGGLSGAFSSEKSRELLEMAYRNSQRLVRLINDILDIEKMEAGGMNFKMEVLDLGSIVSQAVEANRSYGEQMGVRFVLKETPPGVQVYADSDRLIQVLTNLLSNASKFSSPGGGVEVGMALRGECVRVAISDRGPGIPAEFRDHIFSKFAQADSSDMRQKGGTGLGLYIAKTIVERLGGNIGFESEPGLGTTFHFDLPIRRANGPD